MQNKSLRQIPTCQPEGVLMRQFNILASAAIAVLCLAATAPKAEAQVSVNIGVAPECPYGYYDVAPYNCAPSGYYGPEWFSGDIFVGAGPWFHGSNDFRGHVNNSFHPEHGYKGALPNRGEKAEPAKRVGKEGFKGNEERDGRGHATPGKE
jgi:hypothetical protein